LGVRETVKWSGGNYVTRSFLIFTLRVINVTTTKRGVISFG